MRLKYGIGYEGEDDSEEEFDLWTQLEKEKEVGARKNILKETFARESTGYSYKGTPEPILMAEEVIPDFEIFAEYVNRVKKADVAEVPIDASMEELIVAEEEPKEELATSEVKTTDDQDGELDLEVYVQIPSWIFFMMTMMFSLLFYLKLMTYFILRSMQ